MRSKYKKPPINELVIGTYFTQPIIEMRAEHVGIFWQTLKKEFPSIEQQPPIRQLIIANATEPFPMPRFWLKDASESFLIQVQKNAFLLNWRKRASSDYPHFETVKKEFDRYYLIFTKFLSTELGLNEPQIDVCELSYINVIEGSDELVDAGDINRVFPWLPRVDLSVPKLQLSDINHQYLFHHDDVALNVTIRSGKARDDGIFVVYFEQRASGQISDGTIAASNAWFGRAHDLTALMFEKLTSDHFRKNIWEIDGDGSGA